MSQSERPLTLFLAGDSTVADYPDHQAPMAGWGQMLGNDCSDQLVIRNFSLCGKSSKSFIEEGYFQKMMDEVKEGDYLLIQFGHNDEKAEGTKPFTSFKGYLTRYIEAARDKGATPILLTPVQRRHFDETNKLLQTHGDYPDAVRELAEEQMVPLIDLTIKTNEWLEKLGPGPSKSQFVWFGPNEHPNYPEGIQDNTHFHQRGARAVAKLVAEGLLETGLPLTKWLKIEELVHEEPEGGKKDNDDRGESFSLLFEL
ncbi:rhamnogalacturonan acetylesterase [Pullulanibacillus sp. KACC 23026]|uniref:rhamnogalacturonan acetylesterase n=1 Tax=Pullulanibacillus sp. KACC 23026 TaxID=3028315 RepID=UPI0023AE73C5|nr:rhamnogalacturonan acetylesterase [Pullulanibacillus sp. KACC 23026]WEG13702.1 rhamnogalacturonan acetylesterase [Pullulanibacillus sp. KACC 23026]